MGIFSGLSERLSHTELEIKQAMREVRVALLEADVNLKVAKNFINDISEKAFGQEILKNLNPTQQVIKIVNEELIALMGPSNVKLTVSDKPPTIIMMCGLQGAGKTTMCGKLAQLLQKQGKKVLLVACDIYRPAAITQLQVVGKKVDVTVYEKGTQNPVQTAKEAIIHANSMGFDTVIIDTAGRLHIDELLMKELEEIQLKINPHEILLTVDSMTGQDAVTVAETFQKHLPLTGLVLTKLDGDTRGGACLSMKAVTGLPIKFIGVGEKMTDIETFYPDRMASRILGMGDVLTLIEKAQEAISEEEQKKLEKKLRNAAFTLEDYLQQFESLKKMGGLSQVMGMIPNMGKLKLKEEDFDERKMEKYKAMILSMTKKERENPTIINSSRKKRIATGSGTSVQEINQLLKQFEQTKTLMKQFSNGKKLPAFMR